MKFKYYFFKENNRVYDLADLLAYFEACSNVTVSKIGEERRIYYKNETLNFEGLFVIGTKSVVPNLQNLNPKFLDLNIRLEFDILLSSYKANLLIDIMEGMCKRFGFCVYNEMFEDVSVFKHNTCLKAFELVKIAYKEKYEEEVMNFNKIEQTALNSVYAFLEQKQKIIEFYQEEEILPLEYVFFKEQGNRKAYIAAYWNGFDPFIMPPCVSLLVVGDGENKKIISFKEFSKRVGKLLKPADGSLYNLYIVNYKDIKKVRKITSKDKFEHIVVPLATVSLDSILDI